MTRNFKKYIRLKKKLWSNFRWYDFANYPKLSSLNYFGLCVLPCRDIRNRPCPSTCPWSILLWIYQRSLILFSNFLHEVRVLLRVKKCQSLIYEWYRWGFLPFLKNFSFLNKSLVWHKYEWTCIWAIFYTLLPRLRALCP